MVAVVADNVEKNFFRPDNLLRLVTRLQGNSANLKETTSVTFNSVASYDAMGAVPRKNDKSNSATEQRVALEEEEEKNTSLPTTDDANPRDAPLGLRCAIYSLNNIRATEIRTLMSPDLALQVAGAINISRTRHPMSF